MYSLITVLTNELSLATNFSRSNFLKIKCKNVKKSLKYLFLLREF